MGSSINSKVKGKVGELEFVHFLEERGFTARRGQQFKGTEDSPDIEVDDTAEFMHWEIKRVQKLNLTGAVRKAIEDGGDHLAVVAHRANRQPWLCTMDARDFVDLIVDYCLLKQKEKRSRNAGHIYTKRTWDKLDKD